MCAKVIVLTESPGECWCWRASTCVLCGADPKEIMYDRGDHWYYVGDDSICPWCYDRCLEATFSKIRELLGKESVPTSTDERREAFRGFLLDFYQSNRKLFWDDLSYHQMKKSSVSMQAVDITVSKMLKYIESLPEWVEPDEET